MSDWLAIVISLIYIFASLGIAEGLRKVFRLSPEFTRKFVHIAVGMWSIGTVLLFQSRWMAIIPPASFVLLNYISYKKETFKAMESADKSNLGTIYFPLAFVFIVLLFWDTPNKLVAALMPLTWGDAMAAVLGKQYGHIRYTIFGHTRSVEGTVSMVLFSLISVFFALWLLPPSMGVGTSLLIAVAVSLVAAAVEAVSPWGIDNLLIPAATGLILYFC
jgi:phytol kinase